MSLEDEEDLTDFIIIFWSFYFYCQHMNPEVSPWMRIADKQRQEAIQREAQEKDLQRIAKMNYHRELLNQIEYEK